jgi:hypothetical protein
VNIAEEPNFSELKWASWVSEDVPLPTPDAEASTYPVGAYEGAYNCDFLYRPAHTCKMLTSTEEFCPVCSEQVSRRFYAFVDPVQQDGPPASVTSGVDGSLMFNVRPFGDAAVRWTLDGFEVGNEPTLTLSADAAADGIDLRATIEESRGQIRDRKDREIHTLSWTLAND